MEHLLRATARAEATHFWFRGFRLFVTPLLRQAIKGRVTPLILDCGCGTGNNLTLLGQFGRAYGFDLTAIGLKIGREAGRSRLTRASVTAVPFPSNTFDIVTSFDVLYSLEQRDEHAAVAEMFRVAKPGGFVVVNVAAMPGAKRDVDAEGRVAWSDRRVGMGIQFETVDPADQTVIDNFVNAHFFSNRKA